MINLLAATDQKSSLVVKPGPSPIPILTDSSIYVFFCISRKKSARQKQNALFMKKVDLQ